MPKFLDPEHQEQQARRKEIEDAVEDATGPLKAARPLLTITSYERLMMRLEGAVKSMQMAARELDQTTHQLSEMRETLIANFVDRTTDGICLPKLRDKPVRLLIEVLQQYRLKLKPVTLSAICRRCKFWAELPNERDYGGCDLGELTVKYNIWKRDPTSTYCFNPVEDPDNYYAQLVTRGDHSCDAWQDCGYVRSHT